MGYVGLEENLKYGVKNKKRNRFVHLADGVTTILLTSKNEEIYIDTEDFEFLYKYNWHISVKGYPTTHINIDGKRKTVTMHRLLRDNLPGMITDHRDRDKLNNRKNNLRDATIGENNINKDMDNRNKTGYTGVFKLKNGTFMANIRINGKTIYLGVRKTAEVAYLELRKPAELKYFGEYAPSIIGGAEVITDKVV